MTSLFGARRTLALAAYWLLLAVMGLVPTALPAQELAPRAYWPAPVGTKILGIGYSYSSGEILLDPAVPIDDLDADTQALSGSFVYFFALAGRTSSLQVDFPVADSRFEGTVEGEPGKINLLGTADLKVRFAVNLLGAPAMTRDEFQDFRDDSGGVLGASIRVQAPTGEYSSDRVANLGTSRWAFKPELGYLYKLAERWTFDAAFGAWFYGDNSNFLGLELEQEPLVSAEIHLVRRLRQGVWGSIDLNAFKGGRTTVDGETKDNRQKNSRIGITLVYPAARHHVFKLAVSTGLATESGGDYDVVLVAYQFVWN